MKHATWLAVIVTAVAAGGYAADWTPLFNGKNLDNWEKRGGTAEYKIEGDAIVGITAPNTANTFLCTKQEYSDFELELEFKVDPTLNSGVQIRSHSLPEYQKGRVHGTQIEIDPSPRAWTAGIYEEGTPRGWIKNLKDNEPAQKAFKQGEWNKIYVKALGKHLETKLNDVPAATFDEATTPSGFIALQVHGTTSTKPLEVRWRNIRMKDLSGVTAATWEKKTPFGDYVSKAGSDSLAAQVVDLGNGKFSVKFWKKLYSEGEKPLQVWEGTADESKTVSFKSDHGSGEIKGEAFNGTLDGKPFELTYTQILSPTLGAKPPENAVVLFDGSKLKDWRQITEKDAEWKVVDGQILETAPGSGSLETRKNFKDFKLHIEFRPSLMATKRGQARANSGVYLLGSYEVQVLDSYALDGADNECGGIYKVGAPAVNMCAPPLQWQTYDMEFHASKWDEAGKKIQNARVTVTHNGTVIHKDRELPDATGGARFKGEPNGPGPIMLQDHGNPIQFRNIWLEELKPDSGAAK